MLEDGQAGIEDGRHSRTDHHKRAAETGIMIAS